MSDNINPMGILPCSGCMRGNGDSTPCEKWQKCQPSGEARLFIQQGKEEEGTAVEEENCCKKPPEPNSYILASSKPPLIKCGDIYKQYADTVSDGSTASYYSLPANATELQDLISHRNMNAQIGEIFRACYRYGIASHSNQLRDAKKIKFYAEAEIARLEVAERLGKYENKQEEKVPSYAPGTFIPAYKPVAYTEKEGGKWVKWPGYWEPLLTDSWLHQGGRGIAAIKMSEGKIWDCKLNGWRL